MKPRDLANLLNRAAAVIEDPDTEIRSNREDLINQLIHEANQLNPTGSDE